MSRHKRLIMFLGFAFLMLLAGCSSKPECDSFETRDAVLKAVSDNHSNALGKFAAEKSATPQPVDGSEAEKATHRPLYLIGDKIITLSTSGDKRTLTCSGSISATVDNVKASKEINFTVQQLSDGKISVSVVQFQF